MNGINISFEYPVAYWIIEKIDTNEKEIMFKQVFEAVTKVGIRIKSVSFDGHASNIPICRAMGAELNVYSPNIQTYFPNPVDGEKTYVFCDPSHMEKLIRNTWATKEIIFDKSEGKHDKIEWSFITALYEFSKKYDFHNHKLNKAHIEWKRNPMNVGIAIETMSKSVADSLQILMEHAERNQMDGNSENVSELDVFLNARPTINFLRKMDKLWDIFNSKSLLPNQQSQQNEQNIFKSALNPDNKDVVFQFLEDCIKYFKGLYVYEQNPWTKVSSLKPVLKSRVKAGFRGFILDIYSVIGIYTEYIEEKQIMEKLPTYYFLQDAVEMFFGRIRSQCGFNNNPNTSQFKGAYRKLLSNIKIQAPENGNYRLFNNELLNTRLPGLNVAEMSDIYSVSSRRKASSFKQIENLYNEQKDDILEDVIAYNNIHALDNNNPLFDSIFNYTITRIASNIEQKMIKSGFECQWCAKIFNENEKIDDSGSSCNISYGLSYLPCRSTYDVCKHIEKFIKVYDLRKSNKDYDFRVIYCLIFRSINFEMLFKNSKFDLIGCHIHHKYTILRTIVAEYIFIRAKIISKQLTLDEYKDLCRSHFNKLIIIRGQ